jgi:hypothetical protein
MGKLRAFGLRLLGLFRGRGSDDDFTAELEAHVTLHTDAGRTRRSYARGRPSANMVADHLCRHCALFGDGWPLWSDGLFRKLAYPRTGYPHGPRCATNGRYTAGFMESSLSAGLTRA